MCLCSQLHTILCISILLLLAKCFASLDFFYFLFWNQIIEPKLKIKDYESWGKQRLFIALLYIILLFNRLLEWLSQFQCMENMFLKPIQTFHHFTMSTCSQESLVWSCGQVKKVVWADLKPIQTSHHFTMNTCAQESLVGSCGQVKKAVWADFI